MGEIKYINFFGLKISVFEIDELRSYIKESVKSRQKKILFGYSLGTFPYFKKHPEIAVFSNQFDVSVTDGRGLYLLGKILGYPVKSDLSIPNMSKMVMELADENRFSVMIIGSSPENNLKATENARKSYPNAIFYDGHDGGWFTPEDQLITVGKISKVKPDILLIGVSSPKKEAFAATWKEKLDVKIIVPFGGAIDILSGKSKPIPRIIKKLAIGSIWRFIQEPKRLFRDSILYPLNVMFLLLPSLLLTVYVLRRPFSIPKFYNRSCEAPIM